MREGLTRQNYFELEPKYEGCLGQIGDAIESHLKAGEVLYRARIGVAGRYFRDRGGWTPDIAFQPYLREQIAAPPPPEATAGRVNRAGVSFLYLSTDESTAAAEVRPHPGQTISIGAFRALGDVRIADFGALEISDFASSNSRLDLFHLAYSIDRALSLPVTPRELQRYTVTQFVGDIMRRRRYDGIRFRSSLSRGSNACVFRPPLFLSEPDSAKVLRVTGLQYHTEKLPHLVEPTDEYVRVDAAG
jgi:hypothetical protein